MVRLTPAKKREIAKRWNVKVSEVDWKFVEEIKKKRLSRFKEVETAKQQAFHHLNPWFPRSTPRKKK